MSFTQYKKLYTLESSELPQGRRSMQVATRLLGRPWELDHSENPWINGSGFTLNGYTLQVIIWGKNGQAAIVQVPRQESTGDYLIAIDHVIGHFFDSKPNLEANMWLSLCEFFSIDDFIRALDRLA